MANVDALKKTVRGTLLFFGPPDSGRYKALQAMAEVLPSSSHTGLGPLAGERRLLKLDWTPGYRELVPGYSLTFRMLTWSSGLGADVLRPLLGTADGVLFVVDSSRDALTANRKSMMLLEKLCESAGRRLDDLPCVMLYNKRDLRDALPIPVLEAKVNSHKFSYLAGSALEGTGLVEAVQRLADAVASQLLPRLMEKQPASSEMEAPSQAWTDDEIGEDDRTIVDPARAIASSPTPLGLRLPGSGGGDVKARFETPAQLRAGVSADDRTAPAGSSSTTTPFMTDLRALGGGLDLQAVERRRPQEPPPPMDRNPFAAPAFSPAPVAAPQPLPVDPAPFPAPPPPPPPNASGGFRQPNASGGFRPPTFHNKLPPGMAPPPPGPGMASPAPSPSSLPTPPPSIPAPVPARSVAPASPHRPPAPPSLSGPPPSPFPSLEQKPTPPTPPGLAVRPALPGSDALHKTPAPGRVPPSAAVPVAEPEAQDDAVARQAPSPTPGVEAASSGDPPLIADWEDLALSSGKRLSVSLPQLDGFTLNRIGTPRLANSRTLQLPVQATHTDTLNREDLLVEIHLGGDGHDVADGKPFEYGAKGPPTVSRVLFLFVTLLLLIAICGIGFLLLGGSGFLLGQGLLPG